MAMIEYNVDEHEGMVEVCAQLALVSTLQTDIITTLLPVDGTKAGEVLVY